MKINYIKAHFITSVPLKAFLNDNFKQHGNIKIGSFEDHKEIKVTLMGRSFSFVNITGAKNIQSMLNFQNYYLLRSKTTLIRGLKIDSISATQKFLRKSKVNFEDFRRKLIDQHLAIKDSSKFPGVVIRESKLPKGGCCVYFRSGSLNFIGFKHADQMYKIKRKIESALFA